MTMPEVTQEPIIYVDATPNGGYALRILRAYRENCNCRWEAEPPSPIVDLMNEHCELRAAELDKAITILEEADRCSTGVG